MAFVAVTFGDLEDVTRRMERFAKAAPHVQMMSRILYKRANAVLHAALLLVPVDLGTLRASGLVEPPIIEGTKVTVIVAFGGPAASYAYIVHEDLEAFHDDGQAKYLEVASVAEREGTLAALVKGARELRRELLLARAA